MDESLLSSSLVTLDPDFIRSLPPLDTDASGGTTTHIEAVLRSDQLDAIRRVIDVLVVNFAIEYGEVLNRVSEVTMAVLIFIIVTTSVSISKYFFFSLREALQRNRKIYGQNQKILEEKLLAGDADPSKLKTLYAHLQIDPEPATIQNLEYLLGVGMYFLHLVDLFIAFLFVKVLQNRIELSVASVFGATRVQRLLKPLAVVIITYIQCTINSRSYNAFSA